MFPFLKVLARNLRQGPSTDPFPFAPTYTPPRFRGRAELDAEQCILCGICRHVCAAGAIQFRAAEDGSGMEFRVWHNSCTYCGLCAHYCPTKAIRMTNDWHLSHKGEEMYSFAETKFVKLGQCAECGATIQPRPAAIVEKLGARYPERFMLCPKCKRETLANHAASRKVIRVEEAR